MILPAQFIRSLCIGWSRYNTSRGPLIKPFEERQVVRGRSFGLSPAGYDVRIAESILLPRGSFVLASTMERLMLPTDAIGFVKDKSSWARVGLAVQNTVLEPGWEGYITLELTNHGFEELTIEAGDPIAQIIFQQLLEPTESPYTGKYQNQAPGPQAALLEAPGAPAAPLEPMEPLPVLSAP